MVSNAFDRSINMAICICLSSSCECIRYTNSIRANSVEYFALKPYIFVRVCACVRACVCACVRDVFDTIIIFDPG